MRSSEASLQFPVLGLSADNDVWGFWNFDELSVCGPDTLKDGLQDGMELIDTTGARWRVDGIRMIEPLEAWWKRLFTWILYLPGYRIEQTLSPLEPIGLEAVQERVCSAMQAHPLFWCEEADFDTILVERLAEVRATPTIEAIHHVLGLDGFRMY
jgi:hypothetical protein